MIWRSFETLAFSIDPSVSFILVSFVFYSTIFIMLLLSFFSFAVKFSKLETMLLFPVKPPTFDLFIEDASFYFSSRRC